MGRNDGYYGYGSSGGRSYNPRTGQYEDRPSLYSQRSRLEERERSRQALEPVNKNAANRSQHKRVDPNNPPYGERVTLRSAFSDLPGGLIGTVPEKEVFDKMFDGTKCPVYFRKQIYHCVWDNLSL